MKGGDFFCILVFYEIFGWYNIFVEFVLLCVRWLGFFVFELWIMGLEN